MAFLVRLAWCVLSVVLSVCRIFDSSVTSEFVGDHFTDELTTIKPNKNKEDICVCVYSSVIF